MITSGVEESHSAVRRSGATGRRRPAAPRRDVSVVEGKELTEDQFYEATTSPWSRHVRVVTRGPEATALLPPRSLRHPTLGLGHAPHPTLRGHTTQALADTLSPHFVTLSRGDCLNVVTSSHTSRGFANLLQRVSPCAIGPRIRPPQCDALVRHSPWRFAAHRSCALLPPLCRLSMLSTWRPGADKVHLNFTQRVPTCTIPSPA